MQTRTRNPFTTIHTEGALLPSDLLQRVLENDKNLAGLSPDGYHLSGEKLNEAINRSWNRLQGAWTAFRVSRSRLNLGDAGTTLTRERWLLPLFDELDYGRLQIAKAVEIEGKSYAISHAWANVPIHLVGCGVDLERRSAGVTGASKGSPHGLMQEFLNRSAEAQWGIVSNGLRLRVLRDNASLTRQAFLEFDLEAMFEGEVYSDFALLWLICHQSRLEKGDSGGECYLEQWSKTAQEQGTRALDQLRKGVEQAIAALGSGFLRHPANQALRADLRSGVLSTQDYYRQLLRLVYRLIFLFVAEDRDLLFDPQSGVDARQRYLRHYSLARLRRLAERSRGGRHPDLYATLRLVTDILGGRKDSALGKTGLGLPVLGGFLFAGESLPDLESATVENESLLSAIRHLTLMEEGHTRRVVDYKNLGSEELGSIYESLLELHPLVNTDAATFALTAVSGSERKTTGSYYTPSSLIQVLLDSALEPVIEQAVKSATVNGRPSTVTANGLLSTVYGQELALLNLKIVDPACGSGHFLVAAAHRLARRLAAVRTGEGEPGPDALRTALRAVISNCIYGVDLNPMSVELCKVSLWMEALEPGKPLSFLDAHIQCGDSLVGIAPGLNIAEIPDEAFNAAFGDDKATSAALKKRNKRERTGQLGMRFETAHLLTDMDDLARWLAERAVQVDAMPEDQAAQVQAKAQAFDAWHASREYLRNRLELDLWTAAFFWKLPPAENGQAATGDLDVLAPTQAELLRLRNGGELDARLVAGVQELAERLNFFHWELAYPQVFAGDKPGFDCILGNPPWERIKLEEDQFFGQRDPEIAAAPTKAARQKLIDALTHSNPALATAFEEAKHAADASSKFLRQSGRFKLSAVGDVNTYALFAEHARNLISVDGFAGIIIPTGIATDDTLKEFFADLMQKGALVRLTGFENEEFIFTGIANVVRFCTFVVSGKDAKRSTPKFAYYLRRLEQLAESERFFELSKADLELFNPNTLTSPIFRTKVDFDLTHKIYERVPIIENEHTDKKPWGSSFFTMFHMSNDSGLFIDKPQDGFLPLYEAKMFWHFDHRFASYELKGLIAGKGGRGLPDMPLEYHQNSLYSIVPQFWVSINEVENRIPKFWKRKWFIAFRDIASAKLERTMVVSLIPRVAVGNKAPMLLFQNDYTTELISCFLANLCSLVFDYTARQKVGSNSLNFFIVKQFPVLPPTAYTPADIDYIAPRVLELVYTAYDLRPFAEDMGYTGEPFRWDEARRAQIRAELDAYYARLYGLTRDELRYILDPKEVHGEDFPGETFRVLKEKEIRLYGEFRTRRLVLDAWDHLKDEVGRMKDESVTVVNLPSADGEQMSVNSEKPPATVTKPEILEPKANSRNIKPEPVETQKQNELEITWIPVVVDVTAKENLSANHRQAVGVAWLLENFGNKQSIPLFDAQKFSYFVQRKALADLDIPYKEFAHGPYSSKLTYQAGGYARNRGYWEHKGKNVARGRNMKEAVDGASRVFTDIESAKKMVEQLKKLSQDDLGGLATVDFASRAIYDLGQEITPDNIRAYFKSSWKEKEKDQWYTDERIEWALSFLEQLGLFKKAEGFHTAQKSEISQKPAAIQPTFSDFGLYKCVQCGKMVMGYEKENHSAEVHAGVTVEWKRLK